MGLRCNAFQFLLFILFYQYIAVLHRGALFKQWLGAHFAKTIATPNFYLKQLSLKLGHLTSDSLQVVLGSGDWRSWVSHCCPPPPALHVSSGFMLVVQSSPVHSKVEFCSHQCLTLEILQARKWLLSTVTFSRKVKFGIWAVLASSSLVPPGVHDVAVSVSVLFMPHLL